MKKNILLTIPIFNPGNYIISTLELVKLSGLDCLLWFNSKIPDNLICYKNYPNFTFVENDVNMGLSCYLKNAANFAHKNNYDYILNWDQDTYFNMLTIDFVMKLLCEIENYNDLIQLSLLGDNTSIEKSIIAINSGSIFKISTLYEFGFHDQSYFVDCVDYKFALDVINSDFNIYSIASPGIDHSIYQDSKKNNKYISINRFKSILTSYSKLIFESILKCKFRFTIFLAKDIIKQVYLFIKS